MKFLKSGLSLALLSAGLAFTPAASTAATGGASQAASDPTGVQAMRQAADGKVRVTTESATGKVGFIAARGSNADLYPDVAGDSAAKAADKVRAYLNAYGTAFGAAKGQLLQTKVDKGAWGYTVTYGQRYQGVPVFGATLKANVTKAGHLTSVSGFAVPDLSLSVNPGVTSAKAAERAVAVVKADPPTSEIGAAADTTGVKADSPMLMVYRVGSVRGDNTGKSVLAYQVPVGNGTTVRDMVILDANTNKPVNRYSMMTDAIDRELYETSPSTTPVWTEGDPFPGTLNEDQQNLVTSAGDSYWIYANTFGRDSYDGLGATMKTVNNDPGIDCPNANWNGTTTNYCDGVTSDDVVSHEWGHAYTEYTSGLIYQYQSGALNESYSDVWGETVDLINGREDEGETFDAVREVGACDPTAAATLQVNITAPAGVAGSCTAAFGFGPTYDTTTVTTDVTSALDAANPAGVTTTDGCSAYTNAAAVTGHYAYVDRGTCTFQVKADQAIAAGATGLIVGQSVAGLPTTMSGTSTIPATMVTKADGTRIKTAGTVTMTIKAEDISDRVDTTRWLVGEKSEAFGGAIRDMWTPTCYGNPGKVTDAEYNCDPNNLDSGGVHGNSGVPNHAYALLVDGGTYNGQTVSGIGLDKAANIWWRTQTAYLTPISDFTSAADDFEQACTDLVGQPINQLSTAVNGTPTPATMITAGDCDQVVKTMVAVEMRANPVQCDFQPLLNKDTPSLCGDGFVEHAVYTEDFEDGLAGWDAAFTLASGATIHAPWEASNAAPGDHPGGVAYGPAPDLGSCAAGDDFSSVDTITGGEIVLPSGDVAPVLSFDQYIATEAGYDGGNVQLSVNNGAFTAIPAAAYIFNKPKTLTSSATNTNPLAGKPGFTGTDGGKIEGSWGTSQVDLSAAGVDPGDTLRIRLAIGRDGCGGIDKEYGGGWMLDNITISTCRVATDATAVHQPQPSTYGKASTIKVTIADSTATGTVTVAGFGSAPVTEGVATIAVAKTKAAGTYNATAVYSGDATHDSAEAPVTVTIKKAATTTKVTSVTKTVKKGAKGTVKVKVTASGVTTAGKVKLLQGKTVLGTGTLKNGVVTIKTKALNKVGNVKITVSYVPTANFTASKATTTIKVVKK